MPISIKLRFGLRLLNFLTASRSSALSASVSWLTCGVTSVPGHAQSSALTRSIEMAKNSLEELTRSGRNAVCQRLLKLIGTSVFNLLCNRTLKGKRHTRGVEFIHSDLGVLPCRPSNFDEAGHGRVGQYIHDLVSIFLILHSAILLSSRCTAATWWRHVSSCYCVGVPLRRAPSPRWDTGRL